MLSRTDQETILTLTLMAAFADGQKDERERAALKEVAEALGAEGGINLAALYREVLLAKPEVAALAARLGSAEARTLAYEMVVGICDADGVQSAQEKDFLARLAAALQLPSAQATQFAVDADRIAAAAEIADAGGGAAAAASTAAAVAVPAATQPAGATASTAARGSTLSREELDKLVLDAAITNAALELLPESLSTLAIIPLQVRLVYCIGKSYGYPMDGSQAKDFIATIGVGFGSQYLEQVGRKLLGGVLGSVLGGLGRTVGRQAASSGMSFASTWALGRLAERYYGGGRQMDAATLKGVFQDLLAEARLMAPRYGSAIEQRAGTIDTGELLKLVRGSPG
jgi:uncharacterized protein (DUF697 family)/tellurite resistance protein